ncbi:hypothetical protein RQP46_001331 [Phenoliferia psychrophenolica]
MPPSITATAPLPPPPQGNDKDAPIRRLDLQGRQPASASTLISGDGTEAAEHKEALFDVEKGAMGIDDASQGSDGVKAFVVDDAPDPDVFPEGGTRANLTVFGGALALFTTFGLSNSFGAFQAEFQRNQLSEYSPSTISWVGSVNLAVLFLLGLPAGRLFDAGYFRYLFGAGTLFYLAGIYSLSFSTNYYSIFLSYSVCLATGSGLIFTPTVAVVGSYFLRRRSLMIGLCTSASAVASVIFPIILNKLFASVGFGWTIRYIAFFQTGLFLCCNILMRPRDIPRKVQPQIIPLMISFTRQPSTYRYSIYKLAIINAAAVVSRLCSGILADRFGILNTAIPVCGLTGIMVFAMLGAASSAPGAVIWMLIYGLAK